MRRRHSTENKGASLAFLNKVAIFVLFTLIPLSLNAGIGTQMANMFGSMSNSTSPTTVGNAVGTGVIGFGGFTMKNHISNVNLVSWVPPSFSAGCGGIDWYGGSISFINKGEFQQLLRDIASNGASAAIGYAFHVALDAMCPSCLMVMTQLQEKIAKMNSWMSDSCRAGSSLVDALTPDGLKTKIETDTRIKAVASGTDSFFEKLGFDTKRSLKQTREQDIDSDRLHPCEPPVNTLWCEMTTKGVAAKFENATATDYALLEGVMGLVGTLVIEPEKDGAGGEKSTPISVQANTTRLRDLINGGEDVKVLSCNGSYDPHGCLAPTPKDITLKGMKTYIAEVLLGDDLTGKTSGVVYKFINQPKTALTSTEKNIYLNLPLGAGEMIRRLANLQPGMVVNFVNVITPYLALEMVTRMVDDMVIAARQSAGMANSAYAEYLNKIVKEAQKDIRAEKQALQTKYGSPGDILVHYKNLLDVAASFNYGIDIVGNR